VPRPGHSTHVSASGQIAGVDIADAAGHVNSSVTREVYRHQISDKVARAAAAMDRIFGEASGS
jgi:integrase